MESEPPDPARAKDGAASGEAMALMRDHWIGDHASDCPQDFGVLPPRSHEPCNCGDAENRDRLALAIDALCASRVAEAVRAEREACAKLVEAFALEGLMSSPPYRIDWIADRIRARGGGSGGA